MHYLLLAAFLWGTSFIAGKIAYQSAEPALVVLLRLLLAAVLLLPLTLRFFRQHRLDKQQFLQLAGLGVLTYPLTFLLQFEGLKHTSAASAAAMLGFEPVMVVLAGYFFFKERVSAKTWLLSLMALCGVVLVAGVSQNEQISLFGCLLVLASTVLVAFWLRWSKSVMQNMDTQSYTALSLQLGTLFGMPLMAALVQDWQIRFTWQGMGALVYLGIACSLGAAWLWNKGLVQTGAATSGIFLALEPVFGVVLAMGLLGEQLDMTTALGIVLVVLAAGMSMLPEKAKSP